MVSLWLLGIGFAAYVLWRLSEAAFGVSGEPPGAGPRLKSLARSVIYGLAYLTLTVISGTDRSQSRRQQDMTATAMQHPAGRWAVGIAGLIIVICGLVLVVEGPLAEGLSPVAAIAVVAHSRKSLGGGLPGLREILAREGVCPGPARLPPLVVLVAASP